MTPKDNQKEKIPYTFVRKDDAQERPISGVFGIFKHDEAQLTFFHDVPVPDVSEQGEMNPTCIERRVVLEASLSPQAFISIAHWMEGKARELEAHQERSTEAGNQGKRK